MLEVINLSCGYNEKEILRDINFRVEKGEILGIIGPNGSGKTTLLRALTKIIRARTGKILLCNKDIEDLNAGDLARKVAVVPQAAQGGYMSVEEFVVMGRIPHYKRFQFFETKNDINIARKHMEMTDTIQFKDHLLDRISGGEKQLALIARALCQEPELLLLDEPTSHLDITHQAGILDLIMRLNSQLGLTVVIVLHDLNLASEYCDRLLLLNNGQVHTTGYPRDVLSYKNIEDVYKTVVVVRENPISLKPHVLIVSEEARKKYEG